MSWSLTEARRAARLGHLERALALYDEALADGPDRWWLRTERARCLAEIAGAGPQDRRLDYYVSPFYADTHYQRFLPLEWETRLVKVTPLDCAGVLTLPQLQAASPRASVFHQHWLKEIFFKLGDAAAATRVIDRYFRALRMYKDLGGRILWTVHNLLEHDIDESQRPLNLRCVERIIDLADLIHVHSPNTITLLEELVGRRVHAETFVLAHPLQDSMLSIPDDIPPELDPAALIGKRKILTFGMLRPYKGTADLLETYVGLCESGRLANTVLIVAGRCFDARLRELFAEHEQTLRDRAVIIDRRISDDELAYLCRVSDLAVFPYRKTLASGSLYQAATFSLPALVPDMGIFADVVVDEQTGLKYGPGELGPALERAIALPDDTLECIGAEAFATYGRLREADFSREFFQAICRLGNCDAGSSPLIDKPEGRVRKELSFCIPVMNRLADIQATLRQNLEDNRADSDVVEFVVICFDHDHAVERWIRDEFAAELASGYLRFQRSAALDYWHFGRAKNAFRGVFAGRIYASLDGDNFTGPRGGRYIIDVFRRFHYDCVLHQFQGDWGDGTCGRIALSRDDYLDVGYDESFLPRRWDELDVLLSVLTRRPSRRYICYRGKSIFQKSYPFRRFLNENAMAPENFELDPTSDPLTERLGVQAVGCHDTDYVDTSPELDYSSKYNHLSSYLKNVQDDDRREAYAKELLELQRAMLDELDASVLTRWLLTKSTRHDPQPDGISLLAVVKDEPELLPWYQHYRALGVTQFLLVDDHSLVPVERLLPFDNVHVWRPRVGNFRQAKVFWLGALLRRYCLGRWCLTADGDEYLELPDLPVECGGTGEPPLLSAVADLESRGQAYACGVLVDLVSDPLGAADMDGARNPARERFRRFQWNPFAASEDYLAANTVKWSVGARASWAFRFDVRYRVNGSFDSQRKFPLFRCAAGMHLNQGFHDLIIDGVRRVPAELERSDLLPIRHYKLWSLLQQRRSDTMRSLAAYHSETGRNLERLTRNLSGSLLKASVAPFLFDFFGYAALPVPANPRLRVVVADGAQHPYGALLGRELGLLFVAEPGPPRVTGSLVLAQSLMAARDWLLAATPYRRVISQSDSELVLACDHL